jgi:hypothetical protein
MILVLEFKFDCRASTINLNVVKILMDYSFIILCCSRRVKRQVLMVTLEIFRILLLMNLDCHYMVKLLTTHYSLVTSSMVHPSYSCNCVSTLFVFPLPPPLHQVDS